MAAAVRRSALPPRLHVFGPKSLETLLYYS
jgi:hypothetical protein